MTKMNSLEMVQRQDMQLSNGVRRRICIAKKLGCYQRGGWGGGDTPYNGLYGEAPPERGTFFRLEVHKRVGISRAEV